MLVARRSPSWNGHIPARVSVFCQKCNQMRKNTTNWTQMARNESVWQIVWPIRKNVRNLVHARVNFSTWTCEISDTDVWNLVHGRVKFRIRTSENVGNASDFSKWVPKFLILLILNILAGICVDQMVFDLTGCVSVMNQGIRLSFARSSVVFTWTRTFSFRLLCLASVCWGFERLLGFCHRFGASAIQFGAHRPIFAFFCFFPFVVGNHGPAAVGERKLKGIFLYFVSLVRA